MAKYMSMEHLKFVLHDLLNISELCSYPRYSDFDKDSFDLLLDSSKDYADKVMYPVFREMDQQPAHYHEGKVIVHPVVGQVMKDVGSQGYIGATFDYEYGGMQLPHVLSIAQGHIIECANNHVSGYTGLTAGSANLIVTFGTQELYERFVPKMMSGDWGGTMCLTEPQAGSSLSDITTSATPSDNGTYKIKGQKIFISGGDHEYCENFVHLVLARIDGAPAGTKGISLFAVPKKRILDSGSLEANDVTTVGDFQKMGQKGYCTTHLVFGEQDDCIGHLVGHEHKGLKHMFQMMNGARIDVGCTAASVAIAAYYASLQYASERPQGRRILNGGVKNNEAPQTLIINHPDVQRMLLLQKSITEGAIALIMTTAMYLDKAHFGPEEEREKYHDLVELLTPMAKTYPAEMGQVSISNGLQILGGYGYCTEFVLEQYYRDIRIMSLYEGTTGIQSLDLLGRKVVMKNGSSMKILTKEIIQTIKAAKEYDELSKYADQLSSASKELEGTLMHLLSFAMKGEHERYIADATLFMEFMSTVVIAWQWLAMGIKAKEQLLSESRTFEKSFYEDKLHVMKFYFRYELPKIKGLKETLLDEEVLTIVNKDEAVASV